MNGPGTTPGVPPLGQLDIFSLAVPARKHRRTDPSTSANAAANAAPRAGGQRHRILAAIHNTGDHGCTYDEASALTGIVGVSTSTRISELARAGLIEQRGERKTSAGGSAVVWVASQVGRALLEEAA